MSAMPLIATESVRRNEPKRCAITGREQSQQGSPLFDHLVGAREQRRRQLEAERLGHLEIDDELKLGWLSTKNHACA
jgi:hypothetical protein